MIVDSLAGLIKTKKGNLSVLGPELADPLFLDFGAEKRWLLNRDIGKLSPSAETNFGAVAYHGDFFTLDAVGGLHLGDVTTLVLERGVGFTGPAGRDTSEHLASQPWTPESFTLFINGIEVFSASIDRSLERNERVVLQYPAPIPPRRGTTPAASVG
jgi:hypothetical protein